MLLVKSSCSCNTILKKAAVNIYAEDCNKNAEHHQTNWEHESPQYFDYARVGRGQSSSASLYNFR